AMRERVEHADRLVGHDLERVLPFGTFRAPGAAVVQRDQLEVVGEPGEEVVVPVRGPPAEAHDEEDGRTGAADVVGEANAVDERLGRGHAWRRGPAGPRPAPGRGACV